MARVRRPARPPAPLLALLGVVATLVVAWALVSPPFQAPDETEHFSYVQTLAELHRLPGGAGQPYSTELSHATDVTNLVQATFDPYATPDWTRLRADVWGATDTGSRTDGGGTNTASTYPPLYYGLEAIAYRAAADGDVFTRLSVVRLTSGLWALLTVTAAWLLIGELFDRRRLYQLVGAATVGLWPMLTFISASVNPDALLIALWTLAAWLAVKVLKRGLTVRRGLALGGVTGLALVTKVSSLVLAPLVVAVLLWGAWRARARVQVAAAGLAGGIAVLGVPLVAWTIATATEDRATYAQAGEVSATAGHGFALGQFLSYLWQFYLPRLSFMTPVEHQFSVVSTRPALNTWLGGGTASFGWVNVWFPRGVYWVVGGVLALALAAGLAGTVRWWRANGSGRLRRLGPASFLLALGVLTIGALHYTDYSFYAGAKGPFLQGRYLLPLAALAAAFAAWALNGVPRRWRACAAGAWLGGLLVFQVASLGLVVERFYA